MIYLKLEKNKQLKVIQSAPLYQGENRADAIKVSLEDEYTPQGYVCYLHLLSKDDDNKGDFVPVLNGEEYYLDSRFLTKDLNSVCIWLELRKETDIIKTNPIEIVINKHYNIEEIIEDTDISAFEKLLQETTVLYADILKTKEEIEELVKDIEGDTIREELNSKAPLENPNFIGKVLVNDEEVLTDSDIHEVAKTGDYNDLINKPAVDSSYNPSSDDAQSGVAVAEAIREVVGNPPSELDTIELVAKSLKDSQETLVELAKQLDNKIEESDLTNYASKQDVAQNKKDIASIESGETLVGRAHKDALNRKIDETYATTEVITNIQNGATTVGKSQIAQKAIKDNLGRTIDTTYATSDDVQAAIAKLVDSAPEALNTLEELAAALGDDENFSTTVMTEISKKANSGTVQNLSDTVENIIDGDIVVKQSERADYDSQGAKLATKNDIPVVDTEINAFSDNPISNSAIVQHTESTYAIKADVEAFETGSRIVAKSKCDEQGNVIDEYYATKEEIGTKLDSSFADFVDNTFATIGELGLKQDVGDRVNEINDTNLETAGDSLYPSISAVDKYIALKIGDIETSLENIIAKYGLGGETL